MKDEKIPTYDLSVKSMNLELVTQLVEEEMLSRGVNMIKVKLKNIEPEYFMRNGFMPSIIDDPLNQYNNKSIYRLTNYLYKGLSLEEIEYWDVDSEELYLKWYRNGYYYYANMKGWLEFSL